MRRSVFALLAALLPATASAAGLFVPINHAVRITLPAPAADVVVGNPAIADVTVTDQRHLLIVGKGMGVTNLIVTTATGRPMMTREIVVSPPELDRVSMITGTDTLTYACEPGCVKVGDQTITDLAIKSGVEMGAATATRNALTPPAPGNTSAIQPSPGTP